MSGDPQQSARDGELDVLWNAVRERHGAGLGEAELADLRRSVEGLVAVVRELRRVPLTNADAPLELLVPYRANGGPAA
jgi:hypothetical protein